MPARSCVRGMFCWGRFPLASPLPSTPSAVGFRPSRVALGSPLAVSPVSRFVPVWGSPWLPLRLGPSLFGGFAGTSGLCDFPCPFIGGLRPWTSRRGPCAPSAQGWSRDLPVLAQGASVHARGLQTTPGPPPLAIAGWLVLPSAAYTAWAPGALKLSRLNTRPARTPVNASGMTLRACPHDSGPLWVATPFSVWLFHPLHLAGLSRRVIGVSPTRLREEPDVL